MKLTDQEIEKAANYLPTKERQIGFNDGAKFARDFYEKDREADRQDIERFKAQNEILKGDDIG